MTTPGRLCRSGISIHKNFEGCTLGCWSKISQMFNSRPLILVHIDNKRQSLKRLSETTSLTTVEALSQSVLCRQSASQFAQMIFSIQSMFSRGCLWTARTYLVIAGTCLKHSPVWEGQTTCQWSGWRSKFCDLHLQEQMMASFLARYHHAQLRQSFLIWSFKLRLKVLWHGSVRPELRQYLPVGV